jgi:hypothetical protein
VALFPAISPDDHEFWSESEFLLAYSSQRKTECAKQKCGHWMSVHDHEAFCADETVVGLSDFWRSERVSNTKYAQFAQILSGGRQQ